MKHLTEQSPLDDRAWLMSQLEVRAVTGQLRFLQITSLLAFAHRSCQSMTSLFSSTMSPAKDGTSSLPRRQTSFTKPPLRALYDLLIGPMEGVSLWHRDLPKPSQCGEERTDSLGLVSEVWYFHRTIGVGRGLSRHLELRILRQGSSPAYFFL